MRTCACGCGADLDALKMRRHARYASGACRARVSRYRADVQYPPLETAQKAHAPPPRANVKPSGLQVSYRKAVDVLAMRLRYWLPRNVDTQALAERILREALSDRQRAQLDGRRT